MKGARVKAGLAGRRPIDAVRPGQKCIRNSHHCGRTPMV